MLKIKEYFKHPNFLLISLLEHYCQWLPEAIYLKLMFRFNLGCKLNLNCPQTFSEKLQWLKLYNHKPEYTTMVDKYAVKEYVINKIGEEYVIPTLGVWDNTKEIEWDELPDQFVLKTTHGGGSTGVVICRDKSSFDKSKAIKRLNNSLKMDLSRYHKEWPYKNVRKRIIAEQYINILPNEIDLPDYKWYCFNGEPKYCQVIQDRTTKETIDFYDTNWTHQEFIGLNPHASHSIAPSPKPEKIEVQLRIARVLSKGIPFSRIDLYEIGGHVFFGEITFFPMSGFGQFNPYKYNKIIGDLLVLPDTEKGR